MTASSRKKSGSELGLRAMFGLHHVRRSELSSLLAAATFLGSICGSGDVKAESILSKLALLPQQGFQLAQSDASPNTAPEPDAPPAAGDQAVQGEVPFSELNEALSAARARLAELTKAAEIAKVASDLREKLEATRAENQNLQTVLSELGAEHAALQVAKDAAIERAAAAEQAASEASAEAKRLDEELVAMRWQNSQINTNLARAETEARESAEELETLKAQTSSSIEALTASAEDSAKEISNLRVELDATRESALIAEQRGAELEAQLAQRSVEAGESRAEANKLASDLDVTITELGDARNELATTRERLDEANLALSASNQEADVLREQVASNRETATQLRRELETAQNRLQLANASNDGLRQQVEILRTAAGEATNAARLNLIAVENQIDEINAALATVKGDEITSPDRDLADLPGSESAAEKVSAIKDDAASPARLTPANATVDDAVWVPKLTPARSTAVSQRPVDKQVVAAASSEGADVGVPPGTNGRAAAGSPLANRVIKTEPESRPQAERNQPTQLSALADDVSGNQHLQAEALLAELNARQSDRGLTVTVPGTILFAVNSDKIEPDAHDTLAKVAELVSLYGDKEVVIVGHTDAVGDDVYNQKLSERRADLVKDYFVNEFKVDNDRLSAEGQGETRPITSNATAEGRDANRRVEVVIVE